MSGSDVIKMMKDNNATMVDFRFCDTRGKEQHVSVPASQVDESVFEDGKMFDGSSIAGWKGINESDMILMPDASTAVMDPFFDDPTLILRCDIIEPNTMQGYERDPRSVAKRAEAYLASSGVADGALFGPRTGILRIRRRALARRYVRAFYEIDSKEAGWNSGRDYHEGNTGHRPGVKGGYFPVPPVDSLQNMRSAMCQAMEKMG